MNESAARDLVAVRAVETEDRSRALWSDDERAWASRAAAEFVAGEGDERTFLARRARLARERLEGRYAALRRTLRAFSWPAWVTPGIVLLAFVVGFSIDRIGSAGRINILAPPVLGVLAWNVIVYALLVYQLVTRIRVAGRSLPLSPLRRLIVRAAGLPWLSPRLRPRDPLVSCLGAFAKEWTRVSAGVYAARAARILHLAAAALALGLIVGFYVRGLGLEYRASWQSTFLDAQDVHRVLAVALAPGAWLTGLPVPSTEHIALLHTTSPEGGENAARWLHLYAATIALMVILPRLALAGWAGWVEAKRGRHVPVDLAAPYYRRLVRSFVHGPLRVAIVPYSFTLSGGGAEALRTLVVRAFGSTEIAILPPVRYGAEEDRAAVPPDALDASVLMPVFNLASTPEAEAHGALLARLKQAPGRGVCIAVIDESSFRERFPDDETRLRERRKAWETLFATARVSAVFVRLAQLDVDAAVPLLQKAEQEA